MSVDSAGGIGVEGAGRPSYPIPVRAHPLTVYRGHRALLHGNHRLCSVLEELAARTAATVEQGFIGMPFLTPILGTGCLELGDGPFVDFDSVGEITRQAVTDLGITFPRDLEEPWALAESFARELFDGRTHGEEYDASRTTVVPSREAALMMLLTALLTRLFYGSRMSGPSPSSRWWVKERGELNTESIARSDVYLRDTVLPVLQQLTRHFADEHTTHGQAAPARRALIARIGERLVGPRPTVLIEELRLITELSWLELIKDTSIYPGWSDLLLELLMSNSAEAAGAIPAGYRPRVTALAQLGVEVAKLMMPATRKSWESRQARDGALAREEFYAAIADLLAAQADLFRLFQGDPTETESLDSFDWDDDEAVEIVKLVLADHQVQAEQLQPSPPTPQVPHPVVVVTSFDLEIEMALWHAGRPFRIVLPVLCKARGRTDADLVWLAAVVDPTSSSGDGLEELRNGQKEWREAGDVFTEPMAGALPTVVRLSGSPLIRVPTLTDALRADLASLGVLGDRAVDLHHALTIDEYSSMRQSEHELFFAASSKNGDRGLPRWLLDGTDSNPRVWVALGVQIDDPAIRSRMVLQLSAGSIRRRVDRHAGALRERADIAGLAVNKRIDEDEASVLQWLGFQFALDTTSGSLTRDIRHCAEHVRLAAAVASGLDHKLIRAARQLEIRAEMQRGYLRPDHEQEQLLSERIDPRRSWWGRSGVDECELWADNAGEPE